MASRLIMAAVLSLGLVSGVAAKDFGRFGPLWQIAEPSLLDTIKARLGQMEENGELAALKTEMQDKTRAYVTRPRPVAGLVPATEYRAFDVDLTVVLEKDLKDHKGRVFARKGTEINPLHHSRFNKRIVIFDGDQPEQVAFALAEGNELDTLLVLTNGAPLQLMRKHGRRFYFDQDAQLVKKFHIERLPSVVARNGETMLVQEVPVRGDQ